MNKVAKREYPIGIRYIEKDDLEGVTACERRWNAVKDNDDLLNPWAKSTIDILGIVKQNKNRQEGIPETRTLVCETLIPVNDDETGLQTEVPWVCGAFAYEIYPDGYEIKWFCIEPAAGIKEVLTAILDFMSRKVTQSEIRVYFHIYTRDSDDAHLRVVIPILQAYKLTMKLCTNFYDNGDDAWRFSLVLDKTQSVDDDRDGPKQLVAA